VKLQTNTFRSRNNEKRFWD